jgi:hypothetical protein
VARIDGTSLRTPTAADLVPYKKRDPTAARMKAEHHWRSVPCVAQPWPNRVVIMVWLVCMQQVGAGHTGFDRHPSLHPNLGVCVGPVASIVADSRHIRCLALARGFDHFQNRDSYVPFVNAKGPSCYAHTPLRSIAT